MKMQVKNISLVPIDFELSAQEEDDSGTLQDVTVEKRLMPDETREFYGASKISIFGSNISLSVQNRAGSELHVWGAHGYDRLKPAFELDVIRSSGVVISDSPPPE